ncbi:protein LONGIFOLIA 1-like isoform X2 [Tripterygium wilfordii]|uniref:protein LONGIFOLIA 1-like isoform X2 n=1 Tax=Tripterygium wilfordii TaxID=458696 RepID=UPI0018F81642|nr:protein LONGIFOLIA 1-like isoform X2 [Tripterygium wilfordii]
MSAKFMYTENKDLQKQIGCMNGFLQLFDRHHFLSGRRIVGQNHKRLPPGENGDHYKEPGNASGKAAGRNQKKAMNANQRNSAESPRTSISTSSCSSSYSSLDYTKTSHPEQSSFKETNPPKTPTWDSPMYQQNASSKLKPQLIDFRDVVKDSIYRDTHGLSVRASNKMESGGHTLKYIDSPRPMQTQGSVTRASSLNESFQVLAKLRQSPWNSNEGKDGSLNFAPRFSYEGRESHDTFKSTIKLKELPRLSLDSRESSMRRSSNTTKSTHLLHDLQRVNDYSAVLNQQHEPGSSKRPSSVVAKLMGLEALPNSMVTNGNQEVGTRRIEDDPFSRSSRRIDETNKQRISGSPRNSHREAVSPSFRNAESSKKHPASSKFPIEPAPWRQPDGSRDYQTSALKSRDSPSKSPSSPSVYGEMEKRLADLEFKKSGKDLRALKQILEAMQKSKEMLESRKEAQAPNFESQTSNNNSPDESSTGNPRDQRSSSLNYTTIRGTSPPKSFKSSIVIMQPAKQVEKASNPATPVTPKNSSANLCKLRTGDSGDSRKESAEMRAAGDRTPRTNLKDPSIRSLCPMDKNSGAKTIRKEVHPVTSVHTVSSKMTRTASLRMQQKKLEWEKQSHAITPLSDLNKSRRQPNRQLLESGSQNRKRRPRSPNLQQSESEMRETSSCARDLRQQSDPNSFQSESNNSFASQAETEVSSTDVSDKINSPMLQKISQREEGPGTKSVEHSLIVERVAASSEQPSPVSVLDATFYDDMPSPIKKISNAFKDDEALNSEEVEWSPIHVGHSSSSRISSLNNEFDHQKAENLKHLIQNFKLTSSDEEPSIDETASLYNITHPDHMYILEILSASRLLDHPGSALTTMQLHQSGHLINPNLFRALERRITRIFHSPPNAKVQRKLVFDVVNETLVNKLILENSSKQWLSPYKLGNKRHQGQQLLVELCLEVDRQNANSSSCYLDDEDDSLRNILWADLMHQSENWIACHGELSELVLDVERLIFKDLISEVVNGEVLSRQGRPAGRCILGGQLGSSFSAL